MSIMKTYLTKVTISYGSSCFKFYLDETMNELADISLNKHNTLESLKNGDIQLTSNVEVTGLKYSFTFNDNAELVISQIGVIGRSEMLTLPNDKVRVFIDIVC